MPNQKHSLLGRFLIWRVRHVSEQNFILMLSVAVGIGSGLVAVTLKNSTHIIQKLVLDNPYHSVLYFAFPVLGILITVFLKRLFKDPVGEGIPSTLYAISRRNGILRKYKMYASVITSAVTVGFGGSVGLEGPAVSTGSALGSNLAKTMHLNYKSRILLISCATAGAIATIFNAPIAAIIFTIEIFSLDLTMASLIPLLFASVSGSVMSILIEDERTYLFHYKLTDPFAFSDLPGYILLGAICALVSVYFTTAYFKVEGLFGKVKKPLLKTILGGLMLGLLIFLIPPLYGEGYSTINAMINGNIDSVVNSSFIGEYISDNIYVILLMFVGMIIFKVIATSLTIGAGGVGGIFAPSLFIGSTLGFVVAKTLNILKLDLSESNFALAGMAGLIAGVMHAPLTAIFMIAEITGGYELIIPLMLTSAIAFLLTKAMLPHNIYNAQLARRGDLITHNKDHAILTLLNMNDLIERDFLPVKPGNTLGDLVEVFKRSKRNIFPVLDEDQNLTGILTLDDFKQLLFDQKMHEKVTVSDLMSAPPAVIDTKESMEKVMRSFQETGAWNLPVIEDGRYKGFISKSKLFSAYRRKLKEVSRDS